MANELMNRFNMDPFLDGLANRFFNTDDGSSLLSAKSLKTDITENDKDYQVKVDVPGIDKKDIRLGYQDGILSISVNKQASSQQKDEGGKVIAQERTSGMMSRSYSLPNIDKDSISAKLDNGVLNIVLPKLSAVEGNDDNTIDIE